MEPNEQQPMVTVDPGIVIEVLRAKLTDLEWENTLLKAQLGQMQREQHNAAAEL